MPYISMKTGILFIFIFAINALAVTTDVYHLKLRDSHLIFDDKLNAREITITFSGRIDLEILNSVLEILGEEKIRAHFFICGDSAVQFPNAIFDLANKGHIIGSQGLNTAVNKTANPSAQIVSKEIQTGHEMVFSVLGIVYPFIRLSPRQGGIAVREMIKESGAFAFYWNIDYHPENPDQSMRDNLKRENYRGIVALPLHKTSTLIALRALIEEIKNEDLTVISILPSEESTWLSSPPMIRKSIRDEIYKNGPLLLRKKIEESNEI